MRYSLIRNVGHSCIDAGNLKKPKNNFSRHRFLAGELARNDIVTIGDGKMEKGKKLTLMQKKFIEAYDGNASEAARIAGYRVPGVQGHENLQKSYIREEIAIREQHESRERILSRQERQELWTRIALGIEPDIRLIDGELKKMPVAMRDRLKAIECLARSEGDFITKLRLDVGLQEELSKLTMEEIRERIKMLEDQGVLDLIKRSDGSFGSGDLN